MTEVTKDQFFAALYADKRDIMPSIQSPFPYRSEWREQHSRVLFGESRQFLVSGLIETAYYLA